MQAVPLVPRWNKRGMAGGVGVATFDMSEYHRTAVGYRYLTYKMLSFDFETCGCAMWTAGRFTLLPTSNQSGGDNGILTSDRFGEVDANGSKGGTMAYTLKTGVHAPAHIAAAAAARSLLQSDVSVVYRYRAHSSLAYGDWSGSTFLYSDGHLDGNSRHRLAPAHVKGKAWP